MLPQEVYAKATSRSFLWLGVDVIIEIFQCNFELERSYLSTHH